MAPDQRFISLPQAARLLGVSRFRAWQMAKAGLLPCLASGRKLLVDWGRVLELVDEQTRERQRRAAGE